MTIQRTVREVVLDAWKKGDRQRTIVTAGTSMKPLIKEGYMLTIIPVRNADQVKVGDIAVFDCGSRLMAHRIIRRENRPDGVWFQEKGDNNFYPGNVPAVRIIGKVIRINTGVHVVDLNRRYWTIINRLVGYYWQWIFMAVDFLMRLRMTVLQNRRIKGIGRIFWAALRRLVKFPTLFIRIK